MKTNPQKIINYQTEQLIKFKLEDNNYRYHFTNTSLVKPRTKASDTLLKDLNVNVLERLIGQCIAFKKIQQPILEKFSGISPRGNQKTLNKTNYNKILAQKFKTKYIIREKKFRIQDAIREVPVETPDIPDVPFDEMAWIRIVLNDEEGNAVKNEPFDLYKGDKLITSGKTDAHGMAKVIYLPGGNYDISFPNVDKKEWKSNNN
ncbi:MAG: hypothetical protein GY710_05660 [Desulfobacteraceae bacterium]|nr:hypothetical protein [Desulfobacteraceae bacterium]